jgi:hypothetical protein
MTAEQKMETVAKVYDLSKPWGWDEAGRTYLLPRKKVLIVRNSVKAIPPSERGKLIPIRVGSLGLTGSITVR